MPLCKAVEVVKFRGAEAESESESEAEAEAEAQAETTCWERNWKSSAARRAHATCRCKFGRRRSMERSLSPDC